MQPYTSPATPSIICLRAGANASEAQLVGLVLANWKPGSRQSPIHKSAVCPFTDGCRAFVITTNLLFFLQQTKGSQLHLEVHEDKTTWKFTNPTFQRPVWDRSVARLACNTAHRAVIHGSDGLHVREKIRCDSTLFIPIELTYI